MMARRFEDGKRDYRFLMKLFLSLKLPPVETLALCNSYRSLL